MSSIYERQGGYFIRLYDISGYQEKVIITLPKKIASMKYVDLEGKIIGCGEVNDNKAVVLCPPHKIVTIELELC